MPFLPSMRFVLGSLLIAGSVTSLQAATYTWNGLGSNKDLNTAANWLVGGTAPINPPGFGDIAVFDSTVVNINTTPTATTDFQISAIQFPHSADFSFTFSGFNGGAFGSSLEFDGNPSISGTNTNPNIACNNLSNTTSQQLAQVHFTNTTANTTGSATYVLVNSGTYSGAGSVDSSEILGSQFYSPNPLTIGAGTSITIENSGTNSASGGINNVGYISELTTSSPANYGGAQLDLGNIFTSNLPPLVIGDNVNITVRNSGTDSSTGGINTTGYVHNGQMVLNNSSVSIGNNVNVIVSNEGNDTSTGGGNEVGNISSQQLYWSAFNVGNVTITAGDNLSIAVSNIGTYAPNPAVLVPISDSVGYVSDQLVQISTNLVVGNNFSLDVVNKGADSGHSVGGNFVGVGEFYGAEFDNFTAGNNASFSLSNSGTYTGTNTVSKDYVGYISSTQMYFDGDFTAGNNLTINLTNTGFDNGAGLGGHYIGYTDDYQLEFDSSVNIGNNATITVSNKGTSSSHTTNPNSVGYFGNPQVYVSGTFSAGNNLNLVVSNEGVNTGNSTEVGYVYGPQIDFSGHCRFGDGSLISAANLVDGTIANGPQILFRNGFTLTSGTAVIQAINEGTLNGGIGIGVQAGSGGDVNIVLQGNQLNISSGVGTFTIGQLNGDATSSVQSSPTLSINTDSGVNGVFAGAIQNFGLTPASLIKTGLGTQTLSGVNTFTGSTTIDQGTLVLTGSLASSLTINPSGLLKGTGSVAGHVTNTGTISPGQSIGTVYFLSGLTNTNGNYDVEVNGAGQSDLISVTGTAAINGGVVYVSSVDGTYKFQTPYTILEATSVTGSGYSSLVSSLSPLVDPFLSYDPSHVYLTLKTNIASGAITPNELAVANALDSNLDPSAAVNLLLGELVSLPITDVPAALDSLTGYQYTNDLLTMEMSNRQFIRRLYDPLRSIVTREPNCCCDPCDCSSGLGVWVEAGGVFAKLDDSINAYGFTLDGYEITAGVQKTFNRNWTFGLAASYEDDKFHTRHGGGTGTNRTWLGGLYGLYRPSGYYALADLTYGNTSSKIHRNINIGTLAYSAEGKPDINQFTFYGEVGVDFTFCNFLIQPFAGIEAGWYQRNRITESSLDGIGLYFDKRDRSLATSRLGVHVTAWSLADLFDISIDAAWDARLTSSKNDIYGGFIDFGGPFTIEGTRVNRNSFDYALTLTTHYNSWEMYLEGAGENWNKAQLYTVTGGIKFSW